MFTFTKIFTPGTPSAHKTASLSEQKQRTMSSLKADPRAADARSKLSLEPHARALALIGWTGRDRSPVDKILGVDEHDGGVYEDLGRLR